MNTFLNKIEIKELTPVTAFAPIADDINRGGWCGGGCSGKNTGNRCGIGC